VPLNRTIGERMERSFTPSARRECIAARLVRREDPAVTGSCSLPCRKLRNAMDFALASGAVPSKRASMTLALPPWRGLAAKLTGNW
jgi:hypothetical protein